MTYEIHDWWVRVKLKCAHIQIRKWIEPVESLMFWLRKNRRPLPQPQSYGYRSACLDVVISVLSIRLPFPYRCRIRVIRWLA